MALDRKTNFFLRKKWFWTGKPTFSQEKDGLGVKNPRKNMVLGRKTIFFPGKTPPKKKKHFLRHYAARHQKDGFPEEKNGFGQENQLFPREKMVWA